MFCRNCGKEISEGTRFCNYCGTPQEVLQEPAPQTPPVQQVPPQQPYQPPYQQGYQQPYQQPYGQPYQQPPQPAPRKKNPLTMVIAAVVAVAALLIGMFVVAPALSGKTSDPDSKPLASGEAEKRFSQSEVGVSGAITLRYQTATDVVTMVAIELEASKDVAGYQESLEQARSGLEEMKQKAAQMGIEDLVTGEVQETADGMKMRAVFVTGESNKEVVNMAAEWIGIPVEGGVIKFSTCREDLLNGGWREN